MDFAEYYSCKGVDELQSAYWHQAGVPLDPDSVDMKHGNIVIVSGEMCRNLTYFLTFVDSIIPEIKRNIPNLRKVLYRQPYISVQE